MYMHLVGIESLRLGFDCCIQYLGYCIAVNDSVLVSLLRRVYLSIAAAAIYMASQASEHKKTQKGECSVCCKPARG